jgi:hypothetical protein
MTKMMVIMIILMMIMLMVMMILYYMNYYDCVICTHGEVSTIRTFRITVSFFKSDCQNNENESTSVKYLSEK